MRRKRQATAATDPPPAPVPIDPHAVYFADTLRSLFRLRASSVRREVKLGRLRVARRGGRYLILGQWVLDWIAGGEVKRDKAAA